MQNTEEYGQKHKKTRNIGDIGYQGGVKGLDMTIPLINCHPGVYSRVPNKRPPAYLFQKFFQPSPVLLGPSRLIKLFTL